MIFIISPSDNSFSIPGGKHLTNCVVLRICQVKLINYNKNSNVISPKKELTDPAHRSPYTYVGNGCKKRKRKELSSLSAL